MATFQTFAYFVVFLFIELDVQTESFLTNRMICTIIQIKLDFT